MHREQAFIWMATIVVAALMVGAIITVETLRPVRRTKHPWRPAALPVKRRSPPGFARLRA
jgi:hypothetical protein